MSTATLDISNVRYRDSASARSTPIQIVEAFGGRARRQWIHDRVARLAEQKGDGATAFVVSCDFDVAGPWAGVRELFLNLFPAIQARRPDLIDLHSLELTSAVPDLRKSVLIRNRTLTDTSAGEEKVRGYAADRAFRNAHGLIDLLDSWKREVDISSHWIIACDDYDNAGAMSRYFFRELMRRRGALLNLALLAAVEPGKGDEIGQTFNSGQPARVVTLDVDIEQPVVYEKEDAARMAAEIEERIGQDPIDKELHLHELIRLWQQAERPDKVLPLRQAGVYTYFHAGLYKDSLRCSDGLLEMAAKYAPGDEELRREIVIRRLNVLIGLQDAEGALRLVETDALALADRAPMRWRADLFYLVAMVYARYLKPRNFAKGEEYLDRALEAIEQTGLSEDKYHFQYVFNRNGVAMIRGFQRRPQEAIDLCKSGIERLNAHVGAEKHRLHRSVLVYNIGQVYLTIAHYDEAIKYYSAAIAMDPNFSEYYNERGSIFLRMDRLEEACADFCKAIELSPPYYEVFANLGQGYRNMEKHEQAIEAYSRAIDLEPNQLLALLGRAQVHEALGNRAAAIADYSSALVCDAEQWEALANRGVLYYEAGDLEAALADISLAINLSPDQISLYLNRSIVLSDLRRYDEATRDLERALLSCPTEDEKSLLLHQLKTLHDLASPASNVLQA